MTEIQEVRPCKKPGYVMSTQGKLMKIPESWSLLLPGDATITRRVKAKGSYWIVKKRKGNKLISQGVWANEETIQRITSEVKIEKSDPAYQKKLSADRARREIKQQQYKVEFHRAVLDYLSFSSQYKSIEAKLATKITEHAIPVGSGTVARTSRIPVEKRAEAATIAWMRHQTTAYDQMYIPLVKGKRREVRRILANKSKQILSAYRLGREISLANCPLGKVLIK